MAATLKKKTIRSRLRQLSRRLLPRTWVLRAAIRRSDRYYRPRVARAKGDDREQLVQEHMEERASLEEQLSGIQTRRLLRRAWRYYIVAPDIPWSSEDREDSNWSATGSGDRHTTRGRDGSWIRALPRRPQRMPHRPGHRSGLDLRAVWRGVL